MNHIVLEDNYYLMVINMSKFSVKFKVSGPERPRYDSQNDSDSGGGSIVAGEDNTDEEGTNSQLD